MPLCDDYLLPILTHDADESVEELRALHARFRTHVQSLKDWSRSGGPINPIWVRDTHALQKDLHRAQCRAARRIFTSDRESSKRCLGAFLVRRLQRRVVASSKRNGTAPEATDYERRQLEELDMCIRTGGFERFGDEDIAFICDFCDGHLVWEDLESVPTSRAAPESTNSPASLLSPTTEPQWQATGTTLSGPQARNVVFAPLAIANHMAPLHGDWQARLLCPFCEDEAQQPQDEDDDDDELYRPDHEFEDVAALQEHLEWQHTAGALSLALPAALPSPKSCQIM